MTSETSPKPSDNSDELYTTYGPYDARDENGDFDSKKARDILVENGVSYKDALETPNVLLQSKLNELAPSEEGLEPTSTYSIEDALDENGDFNSAKARQVLVENGALTYKEALDTPNSLLRGRFETGRSHEAGETDPQTRVIEAIVEQGEETERRVDVVETKVEVIGEVVDNINDKVEILSAGSAEAPAEDKELAENQPRRVRKSTNGPSERLVKYTDGTYEWVAVEPEKSEDHAEKEDSAEQLDIGVLSDDEKELILAHRRAVAEAESVEASEVVNEAVTPEATNEAESQPDNTEAGDEAEPAKPLLRLNKEWLEQNKDIDEANIYNVLPPIKDIKGEDGKFVSKEEPLTPEVLAKVRENIDEIRADADTTRGLQAELDDLREKGENEDRQAEIVAEIDAIKQKTAETLGLAEPATAEETSETLTDEEREKIEGELANRKERIEQAKKIGIFGVERGSKEEREKIEELEAEAALLEAKLKPENAAEVEGDDELDAEAAISRAEAVAAEFDQLQLDRLKEERERLRVEAQKLRDEGNEIDADIADSKIIKLNLDIEKLEAAKADIEEAEQAEGATVESNADSPESEKVENPTLDALSARENDNSKEQQEKEKKLRDAADRLATLKAQPWLRRDKEAIKTAEAEYMSLAQEAGRELVAGVEDLGEEVRQSLFVAHQTAMWEDINVRVADIKKETKYGKFVEKFGKMHPAARMAIMMGAGVGIGAAAAAAGAVTGGIGGAALLTGAAAFAAKVAKAKVSVDAGASEANQSREKGIFDKGMAFAGKITGLAKLTKWGEKRLDRKFGKKEAMAMETIDFSARLNPDKWSAERVESEKAKRKADLTAEKNKARTRRALMTSVALLGTGAAGGAVFAELSGIGGGKLDAKVFGQSGEDTPQTNLDEVEARQDDTIDDNTPHRGAGIETAQGDHDPLPGEYTADNINVNYEEYLSTEKTSPWAMGTQMDMTSNETAMDDMWNLGENDPGHGGQMSWGFLTADQRAELGLAGMSHDQIEEAMHDDALRAEALNMMAAGLENGSIRTEIVDNVSGNFWNWGAAPVDENGNIISMEEARANGITDTELVQEQTYLQGASLLRVINADGEVSYFNSQCKNFLTEAPTPGITVVESDPVAENPSDFGVENPGTAPDGEAENPSDKVEENPSDQNEENPSDPVEENPGTAPEAEEENPSDPVEENPSDEIEENPKTEDPAEWPTEPDAENPSDPVEENPSDPVEENPGTAPEAEEENPSDPVEENPSDQNEENPSDEIEENPKSEDPDDYETEDDAPEAEVNPDEGETEAPQDTEDNATAEEQPGDEIPAGHDADTADGAETVTPDERVEEVDQAPVDNNAPGPEAPGTEVTGPGGSDVTPPPATEPAPPTAPETPTPPAAVVEGEGETAPPEG